MNRIALVLLISSALGTAVVFAATLVFVPIPSTRMHFNLGEAAIYSVALIFGPLPGALAGGIGSFFADLQLGFTIWAPFSLVIKGLEGYVVGVLSARGLKETISVTCGALIMVTAYSLVAYRILGWPAMFWEIPIDIVQCTVGAVIALSLVKSLRRRFPNISVFQKGTL